MKGELCRFRARKSYVGERPPLGRTLYLIWRSAVEGHVSGNLAISPHDAPELNDIDPLEQAHSRIGAVVDDKYELIELIGLGATGAVYKARNRWAGRVCAVKLFHYQGANEKEVLRRFVREAKAIHRVQCAGRLHPHVVDAIDVGRDADTGCFFVVQELLRGETLGAYLERMPDHRLSQANALRLLRPVVDAIACAHEGGVIHRDLKPDNILLTRGGADGVFPKVLDFGIAQIADERVTPINDFMGTPQYMPPEAFAGANQHDARGDVWALAVILYEALSGRSPFAPTGDDPMEAMELVNSRTPPSLATLGVATAPVGSVIRRALSKNPARRYANARELLCALDDALLPPRVIRIPPGMTAEAVRRALHDPARHSLHASSRSYAPPAIERGQTARSAPPTHLAGRSMFPQRSLVPPPANDAPASVDGAFLGDPARHWWCVYFLASGHAADDVIEILSLPELGQVVELHLSQCALGDEGVMRLADGPYLRNLHALTLCKVGLTGAGTLALARSPSLANVIKLDLEQNPIGSEGLRTLLAGRHLTSLRALGLVLTGLDSDGAYALLESSKFDRLQWLDLSQNLLGDRGVLAFADYDVIPRDLQLLLARNRASRAAIERVIAKLTPRVRKLVI